MDPRWTIETAHLTLDAPNGDKLAVVSFAGGDCGIARNGAALTDYRWPGTRMADCTAAALRLAGRAAPDDD